ncbi:MAG TPA: hypothetical protein VGI42_05620, partial [Chthoniobacterales bacterium]
PSPSPSAQNGGEEKQEEQNSRDGNQPDATQSPTPSDKGNQSPSPTPGAGEGEPDAAPGTTPSPTPEKKLTGDVKGAGEEKPAEPTALAENEPEKEGEMSEKQAELLLQSMKDEEQRVQLDERKVARHVYNDW